MLTWTEEEGRSCDPYPDVLSGVAQDHCMLGLTRALHWAAGVVAVTHVTWDPRCVRHNYVYIFQYFLWTTLWCRELGESVFYVVKVKVTELVHCKAGIRSQTPPLFPPMDPTIGAGASNFPHPPCVILWLWDMSLPPCYKRSRGNHRTSLALFQYATSPPTLQFSNLCCWDFTILKVLEYLASKN